MKIAFKVMCLFAAIILTTAAYCQTASLKVSGDITNPLTLLPADLAKMPHTTVDMKDHDGNIHVYSGVPLLSILDSAGAATGKQLHGKNMVKYLLVKCADGYQVLFSLPEVDSSFTNRKIILADASDGKPLPGKTGPFRIVVEGDKKQARSAFQVQEFVIGSIKN